MDFPKFIAQARANVGMTQAAACAKGGADPAQWSRVEREQSPQLTLNLALRMLKGVGLRVRLVADVDQES